MVLIDLESSSVFASLITPLITKYINNKNIEKDKINNYLPWLNIINLIRTIINKSHFQGILISKEISNYLNSFNDSEKAIALFPLIIYYYQNTDKLEQELDYLCQSKLLNTNAINSFKILTAIAHLVIKQEIKPEQITKQLEAKLQIETEEELKKIAIIEKNIHQKLPLTQVEKTLSTMINSFDLGIYQALYSFLSMPNNLPVGLSRSGQFSKQTRETIVLTGFLLGLQNGYLAIPPQIRQTLTEQPQVELLKILSQRLVARWQGKLDNR